MGDTQHTRPVDSIDGDRTRVLVVDDEEPMRRSFAAALEHAGHEVSMAATGGEALEIAAREHPDVVLLDRHLPDISGQEVLDRLRADPGTDDAVILMVSGDTLLERKLEGFGGGANDYLTKPVELRELLARVDGHLSSRARWLGRINQAMALRVRLARVLVGLDTTQGLARTVVDLQQVLDAELGIRQVAVTPSGDGVLAPPVDGRGREGATTIATGAAAALDSPWLERGPGRSIVHIPLEATSRTFAVLSVVPREEPEPVLSALVDLAPQLSAMMLPGVDDAVSTAGDRDRITRLLETDGMWPVYQPIVSLPVGEVVGYEGLTRFADGTRPDLAFALAGRLGLGADLEIEAARRILAGAHGLPEDAWLSLNLSAATLLSVDLRPVVADYPRSLMLEITEHDLVTDYGAVIDAVDRLGGVGLSVDDAGSGYASLRHVYELRPSMVKLDRAWVADIDRDPVRRALIGGLLDFTRATGARLVGEGIERQEEADVLAELGVPFGQGYLFGRPAPIDRPQVVGPTR